MYQGKSAAPTPGITLPESVFHQQLLAAALGIDEQADFDPLIQRCKNPAFGDFQANGIFAWAKRRHEEPLALAGRLAALITGASWESVNATQPGFVNVSVRNETLSRLADGLRADPKLGLRAAEHPQRTIIDYSSPNVAKELHVGHLRSTIIGDSLARVLAACGHEVTRRNHLGDWGTPMGIVCQWLHEESIDPASGEDSSTWYARAKARYDQDEAFAERAKRRVVSLQRQDPESVALWQGLRERSLKHLDETYGRLDCLLTRDDIRGESAYDKLLPDTIRELEELGLATESEGALIVAQDEGAPMIVRKGDGGFLYGTTDLAALKERVGAGSERILYITDVRQAQHFRQLFAVGRSAGWSDEEGEHVAFGMVLGQDGKPLRSRDGGVVPLDDLLDEAEVHARAAVASRGLDDDTQHEVAHWVALAALKYADLSGDRTHDYRYDPVQMTQLHGDTGPYLQYAQRRAQAVLEKAALQGLHPGPSNIQSPEERELILLTSEYAATVHEVAQTLEPHHLCSYLQRTASAFTKFYESYPVIDGDDPPSRLALCDISARILEHGLSLLGIRTLKKM